MNTLLTALEEKLSILQSTTSSDINEKVKKLQSIVAERDQSSGAITDYVTCGESLLPDTATAGRETIRREMKEIRERRVSRRPTFLFHVESNILFTVPFIIL